MSAIYLSIFLYNYCTEHRQNCNLNVNVETHTVGLLVSF
jgi:hypothetical protein